MNTLKTILVAVDFSTGSRSALEQAARLARLNGASLHVLHVVDTAAVDMIAVSRHMTSAQLAAIEAEGVRHAKQALSHWIAQAGEATNCQSSIVVGVPLHEILEHVKTLNPDLVVAGITGLGESTPDAGSLAHRLARKVPAKVLLVRADHPEKFRKIVACIDFSETSREVAEQARRVAVQHGATVDFLTSLPLNEARWVVSSIRDMHVNRILLHGLDDCGYQGRIAVTANSGREAASLREKGAHLALTPFTDAATDAVRQLMA